MYAYHNRDDHSHNKEEHYYSEWNNLFDRKRVYPNKWERKKIENKNDNNKKSIDRQYIKKIY